MISWVALNMVEGLRPIHRASLLKEFGSAENIFRQTEMDLCSVPEIKAEMALRIVHFDFRNAEKEQKMAEREGLSLITLNQEEYPYLLKEIPDPPVVLYVRGELKQMEPAVALVGSRKATPYGLNAAQCLARDLASAGIAVVSGLARGIDASAHASVLDAKGRTIAVLGSGLNVIYPAEHRNLAQKIASSGALVSEFPLGTAPDRENFPMRNRIISGLSHATVVVEASGKSGSLITARMAYEQGREVMAVPGSIFNESSTGCLALLKDGAILVRNWKDIVAELPGEFGIAETDETTPDLLNEIEKTIINHLSFDQPRHVDQIAGFMGKKTQEILGGLVSLELKNYITQMPGKQFIRVK